MHKSTLESWTLAATSHDPALHLRRQRTPGRADAAERQLASVLDAIPELGGPAAPRCAASVGDRLASLVLFGPGVLRDAASEAAPVLPAWWTLTAWEQYRRFVADVPRGEPNVLLDRHIDAWAAAYHATDPASNTRMPPAVQVPAGPAADFAALWSGGALYDATRVRVPSLLVRGEWDSVCDDRDAARLLRDFTGAPAHERVLAKGGHLMHLETGRAELQRVVNDFLIENTP